MLRKVIFSLF